MEEILDILRGKYLEECNKLISQLRELIPNALNNISDAKSFDDLFRIMHTLKGSSALFRENDVEEIASLLENIYYFLRKNSKYFNSDIRDISLDSITHIEKLLFRSDSEKSSLLTEHTILITQLTNLQMQFSKSSPVE